MVEIAKCKCGADGRLLTGARYASVDCSGTSCWTGPIRTTGAEAIAAWNALMSPAAPEPAIVHYEHAIGATIQQMQEAFQKTEMWKRGDARLVWVNEGDLGMASPCWWMSSEEIRTILRPAAPAPEPAAETVRVRIPVTVYANGYMHISWSRFEDGSQVASGSTEAIGAIITADIPLPQPVEIPGTVESEE